MPGTIEEIDQVGLQDRVARSSECLEPAVVRGIAAELPVVQAAAQGDASLLTYLARNAGAHPVVALHANEEIGGKFGYGPDLASFNFRRMETRFDTFVAGLAQGALPAGAVAVQGVQAELAVPGFTAQNALPVLPAGGEYRLWLGTRAEVAIHSDPAPNIAFVAAGVRRFRLFAPEEIGNLYLGPFDPVPNGTQISLADPLAPDLERFPRFGAALERSVEVVLHPGDAIFIPTGWYHHVEALAPLNLLVNYWWRSSTPLPSPWDALMHGFMALRGLSPAERRVWRAMFAHYVFEENGDPGGHIPPDRQGILAPATPAMLRSMRRSILQALARET